MINFSLLLELSVPVGKEEQSLPYLLYLQGGPGFESPRPTEASGWIGKASEEYRVILMDQACLFIFFLFFPFFFLLLKASLNFDACITYLCFQ